MSFSILSHEVCLVNVSSEVGRIFFIKRARRIYPSYVIMLILTILIPSFFSYIGGMYDPKSFTNVAHNVIMHLLFIHNFDSHTIGTTISTAWTMSIEVQFYVLFPLICIPFRKKPVLTTVVMSLVAVLLRFILMANANISQPIMSAITPIYFDVFAFGMISAYFVVYVRNKVKCIDKLKLCMTIISALSIFSAFGYMCWLRKISFPNGVAGDVYFSLFVQRNILCINSTFPFSPLVSHTVFGKRKYGEINFSFSFHQYHIRCTYGTRMYLYS